MLKYGLSNLSTQKSMPPAFWIRHYHSEPHHGWLYQKIRRANFQNRWRVCSRNNCPWNHLYFSPRSTCDRKVPSTSSSKVFWFLKVILRLMWVVVVGLAVFFALDLSISAYGNWRSNPVLTTVWTTGHPIEKIPFPSITICAQGSVNEIIGIYIPHTKACWRLHNYASMCGRCLSRVSTQYTLTSPSHCQHSWPLLFGRRRRRRCRRRPRYQSSFDTIDISLLENQNLWIRLSYRNARHINF